MARAIGIRYTSSGIRAVEIEGGDGGFEVTAMAAGTPGQDMESFLRDRNFAVDGTVHVYGLVPGDFLSYGLPVTGELEDDELREQLRWEIERKMISPPDSYRLDYAVTEKAGFAFAARLGVVDGITASGGAAVVDVEPVALYNACQAGGELMDDAMAAVSIEGEGITTIVVRGADLLAVDAFTIPEDEIATDLKGYTGGHLKPDDPADVELLARYVAQSLARTSTADTGERRIQPGRLLVAGAGAVLEGMEDALSTHTEIPVAALTPFGNAANDVGASFMDYRHMLPAFVTCFGYAMRELAS